MSSVKSLHEAARLDRSRQVAKIVANGVPVDSVNSAGDSPLAVAVSHSCADTVQVLLDMGADPNHRGQKNVTPVHIACLKGNKSIVNTLLQHGGDLRLRDDDGKTPQDWALEQNDPQQKRKILTLIDTKRVRAYRFESDPSFVEEPSFVDLSASGTIKRKLGRGKKTSLIEILKTDGGFGTVYLGRSREIGSPTYIPLVSNSTFISCEDSSSCWSGPCTVMQNMFWDRMKVTVKRSCVNTNTNSRSNVSDIVLQEIENIRQITYHPYLMWPMAISPMNNMNDAMIVFECVHLGSLYEALHDSIMPQEPKCLMPIMQQISEALLFLHMRKVVHGCITSHCIYLVNPNVGKLGGFEHMTRVDQDTVSDRLADPETAEYYFHWMAPELLTGQRPTSNSDVYSFAAVIWEIYFGRVPWGDQTREQMMKYYEDPNATGMILSGHTNAPETLCEVINAALHINVDDRDTDIEEIYQVLSSIVNSAYYDTIFPLIRGRNTQGLSGGRNNGRLYPIESSVIEDRAPRYDQPESDDDVQTITTQMGIAPSAVSTHSKHVQRPPRGRLSNGRANKQLALVSTETQTDEIVLPPKPGFNIPSVDVPDQDEPEEPLYVSILQRSQRNGEDNTTLRHEAPVPFTSTLTRPFQRNFKPASHAQEMSPVAATRYAQTVSAIPFRSHVTEQAQRTAATAVNAPGPGNTNSLVRQKAKALESKFKHFPPGHMSSSSMAVIKPPRPPVPREVPLVQPFHEPRDQHRYDELVPEIPPKMDVMELQEGRGELCKVKSVHTEPTHAYKVQVQTTGGPALQHMVTVTSVDLVTGETKVTENLTDADTVQVEYKRDKGCIEIATPVTSTETAVVPVGSPVQCTVDQSPVEVQNVA